MAYPDWSYYRDLTDANATALADFVFRLELDSGNFDFAKAQSGGGDLRVYDVTADAELPHWIESWDSGGQAATLYVRGDVANSLRLYYGNPDADDTSDAGAVFDTYYGFEHPGFGYDAAHILHAPSAQAVPTYDGSGEAIHPSVIIFDEPWHGYRYWMAFTPYPQAQSQYENPSLVASHDGASWEVPAGLTNPIAPTPANGYNADTELVYNDETDELHIYYVRVNTAEDTVAFELKKSADGVTWGPAATLYTNSGVSGGDAEYSASIVKHGPGEWVLFAQKDSAPNKLVRRTSADGENWSVPENCAFAGVAPWHMGVEWVPSAGEAGEYWMLYTANAGALYLATSEDGTSWATAMSLHGANWPVMEDPAEEWDALRLYRPSIRHDAAAGTLRVWYAATALDGTWGTGYTEADAARLLAAWEDPKGGWTTGPGVDRLEWTQTTDHVRRGTYAAKLDGADGDTWAQNTIAPASDAYYEVDLYDDGSTDDNTLNALRVRNASQALTLGVYTGQSTTHYIYTNKSNSYTATSVARSAGWHKLGILIRADSSVAFYIDGVEAATLTDQFADAASVRLNTIGTTMYADDIRVRGYAATEPDMAVGSEQDNQPGPGPDPDPTPIPGRLIPGKVRRGYHLSRRVL